MINPATLVLPDVTGAVMLRLRGDARLNSGGIVTNPGGGRVWTIAPRFSPDWPMPTWAITMRKAGGPVTQAWQGVPVHTQRFDIHCYGPGDNESERAMNADRLWRTAHPILCPPRNSGVSRAFVLGHTYVMDVIAESEPLPQGPPDTDWQRVICSYIVTYNEAPAP
jgi:hypothetical protein